MSNGRKKVFIGLSGGVDSSVSAALLKERGYDVVGVFIKVWQADFLPCTWPQERRDAMRVAAILGIPFLTFDFEAEYKQGVVDYMIREYKAGRTPNPDVMCNREIKFGAFLKKAKAMGADAVATGHYARLETIEGMQALLAGRDKDKDQSYFLWTLTQEDLAEVLFPVGDIEKPEVRKLAAKFGLPTASKKDSQGLCFMGKLDMQEFLKHFIPEREGAVLSTSGKRIGTHEGAAYYTIGSRHGFRVDATTTLERPHYVIGKNTEENTITVSAEPQEEAPICTVVLEQVNWIRLEPKEGKRYAARARYRQTLAACTLSHEKGVWTLRYDEPQTAIAPGQSLVIYLPAQAGDADECIGGGLIAHTS